MFQDTEEKLSMYLGKVHYLKKIEVIVIFD